MSKISDNLSSYLSDLPIRVDDQVEKIIEIIDCFDQMKINRAKLIWMKNLCKFIPNRRNTFCVFGDENENFINALKEFQQFQYTCSAHKDENQYNFLAFEKSGDEIKISEKKECFSCEVRYKLEKTPVWLFIQVIGTIFPHEIPTSFSFDGQRNQLLNAMIFEKRHFREIFY